MYQLLFSATILLFTYTAQADTPRHILELNGLWEFEQTKTALPPTRFTRTIPVPGLIDLAAPRIDQYEEYFQGTHEPRYSWYRTTFRVPAEHREKYAVLTLRKSRFNTQVLLNGHDLGTYMECNTPIDCNLNEFINQDGTNELLIRIGDRAWLPKQSATGIDREKFTDIPGIWDDVFITFTGPFRVERSLILPDLKNDSATVKILIENHANIINRSMYLIDVQGTASVVIREKDSGKPATEEIKQDFTLRCQNRTSLTFQIPVNDPHSWSPEDPFLYETVITLSTDGIPSDFYKVSFGMRDFEPSGRTLHLNGQQIVLRGSTINLYRFFEDRERAGLPWDKEWVKKMFIEIPKSLHWNAFRLCIGIAPKFWYDLADEHGILIQNEWPMWQVRGWNQQIRKEYTDWVWTDGSHPSIIIWDAMNEAKHDFIGNILLPELRKLDPTRIWDAGYMTANDMPINQMEEPHYYPFHHGWWWKDDDLKEERESYRFGNLFHKHKKLGETKYQGLPMVLNEYNWLWLNRDGTPGIRTKGRFDPQDKTPKTKNYEYFNEDGTQDYPNRGNYDYLLGPDSTVKQRRELQAYMIGMQTEAIRASRNLAGILSFCYLTNNYGYTGDWFIDTIKDLKSSPTLKWMNHYFSPFAVFIDVEDGRYQKEPKHFEPGTMQSINLFGINDTPEKKSGKVILQMMNRDHKIVFEKTETIEVDPFWETLLPVILHIPDKPGGYLLLSHLYENGKNNPPQISRRYIRIGELTDPVFPEYEVDLPLHWPE